MGLVLLVIMKLARYYFEYLSQWMKAFPYFSSFLSSPSSFQVTQKERKRREAKNRFICVINDDHG